MIRFLFIILILLFNSSVSAQDTCWREARMNPYIAGATPAAAGACDTATDELGYRTIASTQQQIPAVDETYYCHLYVPECSGTLTKGYVYYDSEADSGNVKIAVYLDDGDNTPDSGDILIDYTGPITSTTAEWAPTAGAAMVIGETVSTGNSYWLCLVTQNTGTWYRKYDTGLANYYKQVVGGYATLPDPLPNTWSNSADRKTSIFVTIGP